MRASNWIRKALPVYAKTDLSVCVPRSDPAIADDPKCLSGNRPVGQNAYRLTGVPSAGEAAASADVCNPDVPILLRVDDYVTLQGSCSLTRQADS